MYFAGSTNETQNLFALGELTGSELEGTHKDPWAVPQMVFAQVFLGRKS